MALHRGLHILLLPGLFCGLLVQLSSQARQNSASNVANQQDFQVPSQSLTDVVLLLQDDARRVLREMGEIKRRLTRLEDLVLGKKQEKLKTTGPQESYRIRRMPPATGGDAFFVPYERESDLQWTVFQHRVDGSLHFNRDWSSYQHGFGILGSNYNFWLGLEKLRQLMSPSERYLLRVELTDWEGETSFADYNNFTISNETDGYRINYEFLGGPAGDSLDAQGVGFSAKDRDEDSWSGGHCGNTYRSGWWFKACVRSNLNGHYNTQPSIISSMGIVWETWKGAAYSYKECAMKLRRID